MKAIKIAALSILGAAHAKALVDEAQKTEKRDLTQIAVSSSIAALCVIGLATVLTK